MAGASACPASRAAAGTPHEKSSRSRISEGPCRAMHLTAKQLCAQLGALATSTVSGAVDAENSVVVAGKPANSVPASTTLPERKVMCPRASCSPLCFVSSHSHVCSPRLFFTFRPSFVTMSPIAVDALVLGGHRLQRYHRF